MSLVFFGIIIFQAQEPDTLDLEEVRVMSKSPELINQIGKNIIRLNARDIAQYKGLNLENILNAQAGIYITNSYGNNTEIKSYKIRGGNNNQVVVLVDGIPLSDVTGATYNSPDLRNLNLNNYESIEITKGNNSVLYGSEGTTAVINLVTKKNESGKLIGNLFAETGSYNTFQQGLSLNSKLKHLTFSLHGNNQSSTGISSAYGNNFEDNPFEKQNLMGGIGYSYSTGSLNYQYQYDHLLAHYDISAFIDGNNRGDNQLNTHALTWQQKHKKGSFNLLGKLISYNREYQNWEDFKYIPSSKYNGLKYYLEGKEIYRFNPHIEVIAGIEYAKDEMDFFGQKYDSQFNAQYQQILSKDSVNISKLDVYVLGKTQFGKFHLNMGGRFNSHSIYQNNWAFEVNPYVLLGKKEVGYKVGLTGGSGYNAPTLYELFGDNFVLGNKNLEIEKTISGEFNFEINYKKSRLYLNLFLREETNHIQYLYEFNPHTYTVLSTYINNPDKVKIQGIEIGGDLNFSKYGHLLFNYSFVEKNNDLAMLRVPKNKVNISFNSQLFKGNQVGLFWSFIGAKPDIYYDPQTFQEIKTDVLDYNLWDIQISQTIYKLNFYFRLNNIFNRDFVDIIGYSTKGRNWTFGVNYVF